MSSIALEQKLRLTTEQNKDVVRIFIDPTRKTYFTDSEDIDVELIVLIPGKDVAVKRKASFRPVVVNKAFKIFDETEWSKHGI